MHKVGSLPAQARRHILTLAIQGGKISGKPCKGNVAHCTDGELSLRAKKGFSQGTQPELRFLDVHCNPLSSLSRSLGRQ